MRYLDLTLPSPAANLACDQALLERCDAGTLDGVLRVWEPARPFVVLGYSRPMTRDVHVAACRRARLPILRRYSGGGTVLQGRGCLNYTLAVSVAHDPRFATLRGTNRLVAEAHRLLLERLVQRPVRAEGATDLAIDGRKVSGNAQRRALRAVLFHGTFLYAFDLAQVGRFLPIPAAQPAYRRNRPHDAFLMNLPLAAQALKDALRRTWQADGPPPAVPAERVRELVQTQYATAEWNEKYP